MSAETLDALRTALCPWLQEPLRTLERAYAEGRLGHAWLIAGPRGLGKLNLALVFAERLLRGGVGGAPPASLSAAEAWRAARGERSLADHHPDLHYLFPLEGKRSIAVDQVRDVISMLALKALLGTTKVVLIEPAEAMTVEASNALLKSLEEPVGGTYMLLVSHRPGRLPATIRSRCQTLVVHAPAARTGPKAHGLAESHGRTPLLAAEAKSDEYISLFKAIESDLNLIHDNKRDPQSVADEWVKADLSAILGWLVERIQAAIRARVLARASNRVTEDSIRRLHNPLAALTLRRLFEQLGAAERLRDNQGGGVNVDLALRVLLLGFLPERGRP